MRDIVCTQTLCQLDRVQGLVADVALEQERFVVAALRLPPQRRERPHQPQARAVLEERANKTSVVSWMATHCGF